MNNAKKFVATMAVASAIAVPFAAQAATEPIIADKNTINIVVDGERVLADNFLYNDTTYVPLRYVAEMLGMKVEWNEAENAAYIVSGGEKSSDNTISQNAELTAAEAQNMQVERNTVNIFVNGVKVEADNFLYNDRTYVPLRKISEMLQKDVSWTQITNTATIGSGIASVFDGNPVGTVNGRAYTDTLLNSYKNYFLKNGSNESEVEALAENQIIQDFVLMDIAEENGISAGVAFENSYEDMMKSLYAQYGGEETLNAIFTESGYSPEFYKHVQMMNYIYAEVCTSLTQEPTEAEIKAYYDQNMESVFAFDGVRAKHVLIMPEADKDGKISDKAWKEAETKAKKVYDLAKKGNDFDSLIAEYNQDPGVEENPDGYTFTKGQMVKEFEDKCYSMEVGEISEPVKTTYGYHIIKLEEKVPYYKYDDYVKEYIREILLTNQASDMLSDRISKVVVE